MYLFMNIPLAQLSMHSAKDGYDIFIIVCSLMSFDNLGGLCNH
jgi:hypothetical protein